MQTHGRTGGTHKPRKLWVKLAETVVPPPPPGVIEVWADGACPANPGPGGWATILRAGEREKVLVGSKVETTNNEMEMAAIMHGLLAVKGTGRTVVVYSDSEYVLNGWRKGWVERWERNGWITSAKQPVANQMLWRGIDLVQRRHRVRWEHVKGHSGVPLNERCDLLAMMQVPATVDDGLDDALDAVLADPLA